MAQKSRTGSAGYTADFSTWSSCSGPYHHKKRWPVFSIRQKRNKSRERESVHYFLDPMANLITENSLPLMDETIRAGFIITDRQHNNLFFVFLRKENSCLVIKSHSRYIFVTCFSFIKHFCLFCFDWLGTIEVNPGAAHFLRLMMESFSSHLIFRIWSTAFLVSR